MKVAELVRFGRRARRHKIDAMLLEYQHKKSNGDIIGGILVPRTARRGALMRQRGQVKRLTKEPAQLEYTRITKNLEGGQIRGKVSGLLARAAAPVAP